jgi:putative DNA methylase
MMAIVCTRPVPYADISDFFYVWLKRTVGHLYPEHFATEGTPKKSEAVADAVRYGGSREKARAAYEQMMARAFAEANRVLKPSGQLTVVYAHKTTLGWSTLVDALRHAGFTVAEAWPLDTERGVRVRAQKSAALASSIFLVARKRDDSGGTADSAVHQKTGQRPVPQSVGFYEDEVRPELEKIVRERVDSLWKIGITGADLVIAAVGAGLRAFTRFSRVEYANGEEVPAEKFLAEVEGVVLETLLEKIFGVTGSGVAAVDGPSRFYVLWRYAYKVAEMDAGEAIVFTYGQNVELDGQNGLSAGTRALVEKTALAGRKDDGPEHTVATTPAEQAALKKLVANWRALIDQRLAPREGTLFAMQRR